MRHAQFTDGTARPVLLYRAAMLNRMDAGPGDMDPVPHAAPEDAAAEVVDAQDRTVALSFSSEHPVLREYADGVAWEVLDHSGDGADLSRLNSGAAPLLKDHRGQLDSQIGSVLSAKIADGRGRAVVRIAETPEGDQLLARIRAGEIRNVSVGYVVHATAPAGEYDGRPVLRATSWEAIEISMVATPADPTVGVGRALGHPARISKGNHMTKQTPAPAADTGIAERKRASTIAALGRRFDVPADQVADAIERGASEEEFSAEVLGQLEVDPETGTPTNATATRSRAFAPALGRQAKPYSLVRAINAQVSGIWSDAGFEREVAQEMHRQRGRAASGFYVPTAALVRSEGRALLTTANASALIGTEHMGDKFIESLKPQVRVLELGATMLHGLVEDASIPRMASGTVAEWIAEDAAADESTPGFDSVTLKLKQLSANARLSRRQLKQSLPALDQILIQDMRDQIAIALDRAAIAGTGTGTQPRGILNVAGVHTRAMGSNGGAITWAAITALAAAVKGANAAADSLGWLTNHAVEGAMQSTPRVAGTETMILSPDEADPVVARHRARFSGNVPGNLTKGTGTNLSALIFGNWSDLLIGQWGGVDVIVDDATEAHKGNVRIAAHSEWDIAVRHAEAFGVIRDIVTPE